MGRPVMFYVWNGLFVAGAVAYGAWRFSQSEFEDAPYVGAIAGLVDDLVIQIGNRQPRDLSAA